jgi:hypothetical protein
MATSPVICFGQQPCGFFPKRFLYAKIQTARKLQKELGGKIVFFYHDSDADYRETITILEDAKTKEEVRLNFTQENKIQKKYSPLYKKIIPGGWQDEIARKLPRFVGGELIEIFKSASGSNPADFCLDMYKKMGLLDGIEVVRSSDKNFRTQASELSEFYADVEYEGEIVRAEMFEGSLRLHEGGGKYFNIPSPEKIEKWQKNPGRDERFLWMQSVIHATHYIAGESEGAYLKKEDLSSVALVPREKIDKSEYAYIF